MMEPWLGDFWLQIWIAFEQKSSLQSSAGHKLSSCHPPIGYKIINPLMECSTLWAEQSRANEKLQPTATNGMNESLPLGQEKVLDFFCPFGSGLHMQVTSEFKSGLFLRGFVGLASLNWVGVMSRDCHWSCADYYVMPPPPRNYTFLLHLTRGKATVNQHPPVHHAGWMDEWCVNQKQFFIVSLSGNLSRW